jgi:hypothetical protein
MTTDWPDYNDSQHKANAIAATGVPLLSAANNLANVGNTNIPIGGTTPQGPFAITQIGYEIFLSCECNAVSTSPWFTVQLTWSDSVSGRTVAVEQWDLAATAGSFQQYMGTGPTKGDTLNILFTNTDTVNIMTFVLSFTQNSRVYGRDDWRQLSTHTPPGFTNANISMGALILGSTGASVPANGSNTRLIGMYAGEAVLSISNGAQALTFTIVEVADPTIGLGSSGGLIYTNTVAANGNLNAQIQLPRSVCAMTLFNGGGVAMSPIATITAAQLLC